ncbi:type I restriction endonuclease [Bifidobacterium sp. SO1]|uniref:type I restriction endonuclease n=1 Tax=Bifidobacterium sp. SO1 TaxID=2809029 RepID=UPI001BDD9DBE|nr:type I restriction endonuclease [Bifidobacterium sp. SO1]MBT1162889.1 type I restriction endonuclease subunit R [Bifidobacterium sp. SO1]
MSVNDDLHRERHFEGYLTRMLAGLDDSDWRVSQTDEGFDPQTALYWPDFIEFQRATVPEKLEKMERMQGANWENNLRLQLVRALETDGTINVLRNGFPYAGYQTIKGSASYPSDPRIPNAKRDYDANILRVMRQVHYQTQGGKSLDLVFFVNGIPVATGEVKTELTQSVEDAIDEYRTERKPIEPGTKRRNYLLMYKRGAVVHFAISEDEIWMCTDLSGDSPRFLPFNRGTEDGHAGNPPAEDGDYRTSYFWRQVCRRDNWLHIFQSFVFEEVSRKEDATGRMRERRTQIFPRFHQWDAVTRMLSDVREKGVGQRYLIEHSAGSGKTETITWTAHELADLRDAKGNGVFSSVIVVTDRLSLDTNIKKTIGQLKNVPGYVTEIGTDAEGHRTSDTAKSRQVAKALSDGREIIVVTLQTFLYAWPLIAGDRNLTGKGFAVIIDEAHSAQEGSSAAALKSALNMASNRLKLDVASNLPQTDGDVTDEDMVTEYFTRMQAANVMPANVSFFAFTATPKAETETLFGRPSGRLDKNGQNIPESFHKYPMRQAIEEGYIIDPLSGYMPYRTAFKLAEEYTPDRLVDEKTARRVIARWKSLHSTNVMTKTELIIEHFMRNVAPLLDGQAKAMIITSSRPAVVRYKYAFDAYLKAHPEYDRSKIEPHLQFKVPGEPLVAFSDKVSGSKCVLDDEYLNDNPFAEIDPEYDYTESNMNDLGYQSVENAFDTPQYRLMIVANKFQTGFDQPKLCALYIDKPIANDIEIVQTYSRVNRTYPGKDRVYVLDFVNDPDTVVNAFRKYDTGAHMSEAQDTNIVYRIKQQLDQSDIYTADDFDKYRDAQYKAVKEAVDDKGRDTYRRRLYNSVSLPADRWMSRYRAHTTAYATWADVLDHAEHDHDTTTIRQARQRMEEEQTERDRLVTFRKLLKRYCSAYTFISQIVDLGEPDLEVFNGFAKLLAHRIASTGLDQIDIKGLVLSDYRIDRLRRDDDGKDRELKPMGAGGGHGGASKRRSLKRIVAKLNETWGDDVNVIAAARVVNCISDYVAADTVTQTRIANSTNSKESVVNDGRMKNIIKSALVSMVSNDLGELAAKAMNDPQSIDSLTDQVYDQIAMRRRYDIPDIQKYIEQAERDHDER